MPYYHNESKSDIQDHFIENPKEYDGSKIEIWKPFTTAIPIFTKSDIPEMLKDTKENPMRHLILSVFNSRKLGRNPEPKWIYLIITLSALILLGLRLTLHGVYQYKKSNRSRNRVKTIDEPVLTRMSQSTLKARMMPFCQDESTQHLEAEGTDTANFTDFWVILGVIYPPCTAIFHEK